MIGGMKDPTLKPIANHIASLYRGELSQAESIEAARNLTGFVGLLLESAKENGVDLDDTP